jgi:hypothetical protein
VAGFYSATPPQNAAVPWPTIAPPRTPVERFFDLLTGKQIRRYKTFGNIPHTLADVAAAVKEQDKKLWRALLLVAETEVNNVVSICPKKLGTWLRGKHEVPSGG